MDDITDNLKTDREFTASMDEEKRTKLLAGWKKAVNCVRGWAKP